MIRKMQRKFVAIVMIAYFILAFIIYSGIHIIGELQVVRQYDQLLDLIMENDGEIPNAPVKNQETTSAFGYRIQITQESQFENRYFLIYLDKNKEYVDSNLDHVAAVSDEEAQKCAAELEKLELSNNRRGNWGEYRYLVKKTDSGYTVAFADATQALLRLSSTRLIVLSITTILMILLFFIASFLSGKVMRPVIENMEKQKRFITDAGHELKTPLAVISANADVLELMNGKNEWIDSIRNQVCQLNDLVKRLLFLSKMEEGQQLVMAEFDFSETALNKVKELSTIALSTGKEFDYRIDEGIIIKGDQSSLEQLVSVLTENAVKYCKEGGKIGIRLFKAGKTVHFEVRNTSEGIDEGELNHLFERFYRPDTSRNRTTGGHGIGLSIAKAVTEAHRGKIHARNEGEQVAFCVDLPC